MSLLSDVSSDMIGISGVISEIFFVINLFTSMSPLLTGVLSDLISFVRPSSLRESDNSPAKKMYLLNLQQSFLLPFLINQSFLIQYYLH